MYTKPPFSFENIQVAFASKSDAALKKMFLIFTILNSSLLSSWGMKWAGWALKSRLPVKGILKKTIFDHFCGGESIEECNAVIKELNQDGIGVILDYSVEGEGREEGFDQTKDEILRTIQNASTVQGVPFTVFKVSGLGDLSIMSKIQEKMPLTSSEESSFQRTRQRVNEIFEAAYRVKVRVLVDGEESWFQEVVDQMVEEAMEKYNKETAIVFHTYQMYQKGMTRQLKDSHYNSVARGYYLGAKLVRGAYMEKEAERAQNKGLPNPIHANKEATDRAYDEALKFCVNNKQRVYTVSGTHNELSNIILTELMALHGVKPDDKRVYFAQLYGMGDDISYNLAKAGYNVVKYLPYGPVEAVMPYLARRASENTSVAGQSSRELTLIKNEFARRKAEKRTN